MKEAMRTTATAIPAIMGPLIPPPLLTLTLTVLPPLLLSAVEDFGALGFVAVDSVLGFGMGAGVVDKGTSGLDTVTVTGSSLLVVLETFLDSSKVFVLRVLVVVFFG